MNSTFRSFGSHMLVSYQAKQRKKPIIVLSSLHKFPETFDDEKKLPCVIHDYNQKKSGVDAVDQCIEYYTVRRISRSKESYLKPKVKIALLSFGYEVDSKSLQPIEVNTCLNRKKRCYLCPPQPGRKVRQTCNNCGRNVCLSHSHNSTMVICQQCDEMK